MRAFADLLYALGTTTKTNEKIDALAAYFAIAGDRDKLWTIALFTGRKPKRPINSTLLRQWCCELTNTPEWLFNECYHTVGDLSETIALLVSPFSVAEETMPLHYYTEQLISLQQATEEEKKEFMVSSWKMLGGVNEIFVFNKLLSGNFRIGVSAQLIINAIARVSGKDASVVAHNLMGKWDPSTDNFESLVMEEGAGGEISRPYPFFLAYPVDEDFAKMGDPQEWQAEWKWDGIRGQLIKRQNKLFVWSRGEELITDRFPEFEGFFDALPDGTVMDGEIMATANGQPLPFGILQQRIGRKNLTKKILADAPAGFFVYDLLEIGGVDLRQLSMQERRARLEEIILPIRHPALSLSPSIQFNSWDELAAIRAGSRQVNAEGIMLKRKSSPYQAGRKRGDWWKWKIEPLTIDAVMIYAQKGSGRRSGLYTDYTFALRDGDKLVPFAKAYSGLTDKEIAKVDAFVKRNSIEKFGPVRTVKPELVFELAFEGISKSSRHKSGVAVRFPRIQRWRTDKPVEEINTLNDLVEMLNKYGK